MATRRRLTPDARRAELVEIGARHFAQRPYDEVRLDAVADEAGVSRALLYRYFPGKRALFASVYAEAAASLLSETTLDDPSRSMLEQLVAGLDAHIDYFVANRNTVLAANRALAGDPTIQTIISDEMAELRDRLLHASGLRGSARTTVSPVLMSWLVFVRVLCVEWLERPAFSRTVLRDMCAGALVGALGPVLSLDE
ncbi:MAG: TetR/AcrR family transcriptional regulator [Nocardioides sp.]